jgi:hypothetical protein
VGDGGRRVHAYPLTIRVGLLAVLVGFVAAGAAFLSVAGDCAGPPVDVACRHLTEVLSERLGVLAAVITAVAFLTMAGIAKLDRERGSRLAHGPRQRG